MREVKYILYLVLSVVVLEQGVNEREFLLPLAATATANHTSHDAHYHLLVTLKLRLPL